MSHLTTLPSMDTGQLLKELTEARGPSGYETEVREIVKKRFSPFADEVRVDALGSVIALKKGEGSEPRPSLLLAGHMDEIALITAQMEKGFLHITQIGGFDPRVLIGQEVIVHGRRKLPGVIATVPPHVTNPADREKPATLDKLWVDVGLPPLEVESLIRVGDPITLRVSYRPLNGGFAAGKSLDDRAAVAAIALCLEDLRRYRHSWDVYAVATVQEETGIKGATTAGYGIAPTAAIAVDVTFGMQNGLSAAETVKMDGGPCILFGPNAHPRLNERLVAAAKAAEVPYQMEAVPGNSGTDGWALQVSRSGVPTAILGIPLRAMHTAVETVAIRDVERTARLMADFISRLDTGFAAALETKDALAAGPAEGRKP
jgi:tetrahedral aminopeptidase